MNLIIPLATRCFSTKVVYHLQRNISIKQRKIIGKTLFTYSHKKNTKTEEENGKKKKKNILGQQSGDKLNGKV